MGRLPTYAGRIRDRCAATSAASSSDAKARALRNLREARPRWAEVSVSPVPVSSSARPCPGGPVTWQPDAGGLGQGERRPDFRRRATVRLSLACRLEGAPRRRAAEAPERPRRVPAHQRLGIGERGGGGERAGRAGGVAAGAGAAVIGGQR